MTEISAHVALYDLPSGCPLCGKVTGVRIVGTEHWGYRERHLATWWAGSGVLAAPQSTDSLRASIRFLSDYRVLDGDVHSDRLTPEPEDQT